MGIRQQLAQLRARGLSTEAAIQVVANHQAETSRLSSRAAAQAAVANARPSSNRLRRATSLRYLAREIQARRGGSLEAAQREAHRLLSIGTAPSSAPIACANRSDRNPPLFLFSQLSQSSASGGRVWIQLAQLGSFKGHPQGPFEITTQTLDSICRNFAHDGLPIAIDFEHASEMPPTSGNIAAGGAPAVGWIHALDNRGQSGLWGHVEWLEPARSLIKEGKYRWISPAIRFKSKARVSGQEAGPRLSSAGVTNSPFLVGLSPLVAA